MLTVITSFLSGAWAKLALGLGIAAAVGAVLLGARNAGRLAERAESQKKALEVKDAQLKAAARGPRSKSDLVDRLRERGL